MLNDERSAAAPRTFPDAWIEHWAPVYAEPHNNRRLRARRVSFETFLVAPVEILAALDNPRVIVARAGLLPAQREIQIREDTKAALVELVRHAIELLEREGARCSNGRYVEKLRHHTYPRQAAKRLAIARYRKEVER